MEDAEVVVDFGETIVVVNRCLVHEDRFLLLSVLGQSDTQIVHRLDTLHTFSHTPSRSEMCDLRLGAARGLRGKVGGPLLCSPPLSSVLPWQRAAVRSSVAARPFLAALPVPGDDSGVIPETGGDRSGWLPCSPRP